MSPTPGCSELRTKRPQAASQLVICKACCPHFPTTYNHWIVECSDSRTVATRPLTSNNSRVFWRTIGRADGRFRTTLPPLLIGTFLLRTPCAGQAEVRVFTMIRLAIAIRNPETRRHFEALLALAGPRIGSRTPDQICEIMSLGDNQQALIQCLRTILKKIAPKRRCSFPIV